MVELVRANQLCRAEVSATAIAKPPVGGERGMLREPTRDCRGSDAVAIARRDFFCGLFERVAAIVQRERVQDFREGICLITNRSRAWLKRATARTAAKERNVFQFFLARTFLDEAFAVAMWAAIWRLDF
jgi:hypothetical protein